MKGFDESERKGLIGKIIKYFDNGSPSLEPTNEWGITQRKKNICCLNILQSKK